MKTLACLLLLLTLCACGSYEARAEGTWQGDGSFTMGVEEKDTPPFEGADRWTFDGESAAVATVDGREVTLHYSMTDDTLTLNDGGEPSWGVTYELKGDTLRIGSAEFTKVR